MSVPNIAWLWPVRFSATSYVLRATINGVTENLTFPATGSLDTTLDYWLSGDAQSGTESDGTGRTDLVRLLQTCLRAHSEASTLTATLSMTTFKVTVADSVAIQLLWAHGSTTLDPALFGWTLSSTSSATSITAPNCPTGQWRPGRAVSEDSRDRQPVVGGVAETISGLARVSALALPAKERRFLVRWLPQAVALEEYASATDPDNTFETAWTSALRLGRPWRHYADQATIDDGAGAYQVYRVRDLADPLERDEIATWWRVAVQARRVV